MGRWVTFTSACSLIFRQQKLTIKMSKIYQQSSFILTTLQGGTYQRDYALFGPFTLLKIKRVILLQVQCSFMLSLNSSLLILDKALLLSGISTLKLH